MNNSIPSELKMTSPFKFFTPLKVRFNETDLQGHVNFAHYLTYFDVGATEYMAAIGYDYDALLAEGVDLLYAESHCNYKSPVKWPETLRIHTRIAELGRRSLRYEFDVRAEQDGRQVATGHIIAIIAERGTWAEREVPAKLRQAVTNYENKEITQ
ncbi:MAG: acyl-CoA thioesterase [Chloroflexi bacterium]|nr:acyl-CoA thioesterase [Chloroflexota bacterium]